MIADASELPRVIPEKALNLRELTRAILSDDAGADTREKAEEEAGRAPVGPEGNWLVAFTDRVIANILHAARPAFLATMNDISQCVVAPESNAR